MVWLLWIQRAEFNPENCWSLSDREQQWDKHFKCHQVYSRKMALEGRRRPRFSFLWFRRATDLGLKGEAWEWLGYDRHRKIRTLKTLRKISGGELCRPGEAQLDGQQNERSKNQLGGLLRRDSKMHNAFYWRVWHPCVTDTPLQQSREKPTHAEGWFEPGHKHDGIEMGQKVFPGSSRTTG